MRAFLEDDGDAGKHVHRAVLLDVASVFDDDSAPVAADGSAGSDVDVAPNDDVAGNRSVRVNERRCMDHWGKSVEREDVAGRHASALSAASFTLRSLCLNPFYNSSHP